MQCEKGKGEMGKKEKTQYVVHAMKISGICCACKKRRNMERMFYTQKERFCVFFAVFFLEKMEKRLAI